MHGFQVSKLGAELIAFHVALVSGDPYAGIVLERKHDTTRASTCMTISSYGIL